MNGPADLRKDTGLPAGGCRARRLEMHRDGALPVAGQPCGYRLPSGSWAGEGVRRRALPHTPERCVFHPMADVGIISQW